MCRIEIDEICLVTLQIHVDILLESIFHLQLIGQFGNHTTYSGVGCIILPVLNVIASHDFRHANVVVALPLVEGHFAEEFFLVVFELSHFDEKRFLLDVILMCSVILVDGLIRCCRCFDV